MKSVIPEIECSKKKNLDGSNLLLDQNMVAIPSVIQ